MKLPTDFQWAVFKKGENCMAGNAKQGNNKIKAALI